MEAALVRYLACFVLLLAGPLSSAQTVRIRVINGENGKPLQKQQVSASLIYRKGENAPEKYDAILNLETDSNGEAQFSLPEPAPAHLSAQLKIDWGRWHCGCRVLAVTQDVIQRGIVESAAVREGSSASIKADPGEILLVTRPMSFFERLLYPLLKE